MSGPTNWELHRHVSGEYYFNGAAEALVRIGRGYDDRLARITTQVADFSGSAAGHIYFDRGAALLERKTEEIMSGERLPRSREWWRQPIRFVLVGLATCIFRSALAVVLFFGRRASARAEQAAAASTPDRTSSKETLLRHLPSSQSGLKVSLGRAGAITDNQRALYEWLRANQQEVANRALLSLRSLYACLRGDLAAHRANEPWLSIALPLLNEPEAINETFKLTEVELHSAKWRIGLRFVAIWEDEHELEVLIDNTVVGDAAYRGDRNFK